MGFEIGYWGIYFFSSFFASISDEDYVFFLLFWNSGMEIVGRFELNFDFDFAETV